MQSVTRTLTEFEVKAYDLCEVDGELKVSEIASCKVYNTTMTKGTARAELAKAIGKKLPKGVTIKWWAVSTVTYAMNLDDFIENSIIIKTENITTN